MKILHIISGDLWGGAESVVYNLMLELSQHKGITPYALLFNHGALENRLRSNGIHVHIIDENKCNQFALLRMSYKYTKNLMPQIIHTHKHKENVIGSISSLLLNIPSIRTVHGDSESDITIKNGVKYIYTTLNILTGKLIQKYIVSVSSQLAQKLTKKYPIEKIKTIHNGIFIPTDEAHSKKKSGKSTIDIAIIARCVPVKRIDIFIQIAKVLLNSSARDYHFYIFGDGPLLASLRSLSKQLETERIITFMGHINGIKQHLERIDLVLITSDHEGLPMNLLEAISMKIPVISHRVGDVANVLCNGNCGLLIDSQNPEDYAKAIERLMGDDPLINEMTDNAYKNIKENYSLKSMANKYISIYESLLRQESQ